MIPEFIGRFTTTITLQELTLSQLIEVLTDIKNSFIKQYAYLFSIDDINLSFTDQAIEKIAQNCIDLKTGARGLHTEIERVLMPHLFHINKYKENNLTDLIIDVEHINEPKSIF
jgi:ATP-dependent Clp protease ATP-binding subunit ClpX